MAIKDLAQNVAIAGFTALGVEKLTDKAHELERMATGETSPEEFHKSAQHALLLYQQAQYELLQKIADALAPEAMGDIEESIVIPVYPQSLQLSRFGRPHSMLYVKSSINLSVEAPNLGQFTVTGTAVGWNQLDLPDGVRISIPSGGSPTTALYRVSVNAVGTANPSSGGGGGGGNVNLNQVGGTSFGLGQTTMANSLPVALASNQGVIPENLSQVGGAAFALGQNTMANSLPVALASNQGVIPINITQLNGASPSDSNSFLFEPNLQNWTRLGQVFTSTSGILATATNANLTEAMSFFNPGASGKTILIFGLNIFSGAATTFSLYATTADAALGTAITPLNNNRGNATSSVATVNSVANGVITSVTPIGTLMAISGVPANTYTDFLPNGRVIVLQPGQGIEATVFVGAAGTKFGFNILAVEF